MKKYRSIFISDIHLGSKDSKAKLLANFLDNNTANTIYLVGDIIDFWKIKNNKWRWKKSHTEVIRRLLKKSESGARIVYVIGNHDEILRPMLNYGIRFGTIDIVNSIDHIGVNGCRYLVTHGDMFDGISKISPWLCYLGDKMYDLLLSLNSNYNWFRRRLGFGYWSFSKAVKRKVKHAMEFVFSFEQNLVEHCRRKHYDGVIAGHIHTAEIKDFQEIEYMNCGDWQESCTAIVENFDGTFELITWDYEHEKNVDYSN